MPILSHEVSNACSTLYVHTRTVYVRARTEINIPHINFMKDKMGPGPIIILRGLDLIFFIHTLGFPPDWL
jgi:hypothetical protein